jgi:hypothetical protein
MPGSPRRSGTRYRITPGANTRNFHTHQTLAPSPQPRPRELLVAQLWPPTANLDQQLCHRDSFIAAYVGTRSGTRPPPNAAPAHSGPSDSESLATASIHVSRCTIAPLGRKPRGYFESSKQPHQFHLPHGTPRWEQNIGWPGELPKASFEHRKHRQRGYYEGRVSSHRFGKMWYRRYSVET